MFFEAKVKNLATHDSLGRPKTKEVIVRVTNKKTNKVIWNWCCFYSWVAVKGLKKFVHHKDFSFTDLSVHVYEIWTDHFNVNKIDWQVWVWSKEKFMNRKFLIEDIYEMWTDGDHVEMDKKVDPFWDPVEDIYLGRWYSQISCLWLCGTSVSWKLTLTQSFLGLLCCMYKVIQNTWKCSVILLLNYQNVTAFTSCILQMFNVLLLCVIN